MRQGIKNRIGNRDNKRAVKSLTNDELRKYLDIGRNKDKPKLRAEIDRRIRIGKI